MVEYKNVTIKEETWHALRIAVRESDHESQHQFIKSALVEYAQQNDVPVPKSVLDAMEQETPEPLDWQEE